MMKRFGFDHGKVLLTVIHTLDDMQVIRNVEVALANGADGVFVINQTMHVGVLLDLIPRLRKAVPALKWLGLNLLGMPPATTMLIEGVDASAEMRRIAWMLELPKLINGVWSDTATGEECRDVRNVEPPRPLWFGGAAFKYQPHVPLEDIPALVAKLDVVDVVTTTGDGTGIAARLDKIKWFRDALGSNRPLGIASGITPENVGDYLPYVNAFLVATGIESSFGHLDPRKVRKLADAIHAFKPVTP